MGHFARALLLCTAAVLPFSAPLHARAADLDTIFKAYTPQTPGCAVGVEKAGQVVTRSYGSADLEHAVPNTPDTIFEAGSLSKQFTATAILLLAQDGKLALTDDIRKYLPEMPDYGTPITINNLLSHTSGIRDWGAVLGIGGWPRTTQIHTNADVLQIAARQKALNYPPGSAYSYTNSGYNLAAIIVERVSGVPLAQFTKDHMFTALGMSKTAWRDDFRRIVPNRAVAYDAVPGGFAQDMPFEDAYGNGGLLTTVGDLLIWNDALTANKLGAFVTSHLEEQAVLTDGRRIFYGRGLMTGTYYGTPEIFHSGSTAAYRAWIGRYPAQGAGVAVLCNVDNVSAVQLAHASVQQYLPPAAAAVKSKTAPAAELARFAGLYVDERTGGILRVAPGKGTLVRLGDAPDNTRTTDLIRLAAHRYKNGSAELTFNTGMVESRTPDGETVSYRRVEPAKPSAAEMQTLVGRYASTEADATLIVSVDGDRLVLTPSNRPSAPATLIPLYRDAYLNEDGILRIVRGPDGQVQGLRFTRPRVYNLVFERVESP